MEEKEVKKRRGYKTKEQQNEAMKRYYNNNPDAKIKKKITTAKGQCKRFIKDFATLEELQEIENIVTERKKELKKEIK